MSDNIGIWRRIPVGGTFTLSVQGLSASDQNFVAVARVLPTSGRELQWFDHHIHPGPKTLVLAKDTAYSVRVGVKFLARSTEHAVIAAQLSDSAGNVVKDLTGASAYSHEVNGKNGSPMRRATLILFTN